MKESYGEGLANHTSLESCGVCSNALAEALTEGSTGGLLSSEITTSRVPTSWFGREGNMFYCAMQAVEQPGGVLEPGMCGHSLRGNREIRKFSLDIIIEERPGKVENRTTGMKGSRKSDSLIVSKKPLNKICDNKHMAEEVEKSELAKGNLSSKTGAGHRAG
jgi:hypothetical protein